MEQECDQVIASVFSKYLQSIPIQLNGNIPTNKKDPLDYVCRNAVSLVLSRVTTVKCLGVIKDLNNTKTDIICYYYF